jgi:hypothetical protein
MELEHKFKMLQMAYVGVLVDSLRWYTKEGILEKVTEEKRKEQFISGKQRLSQFGISEPEQVFIKLSDLFNCACWKIDKKNSYFSAEAKGCLLCAASKKFMTGSPCNIYCLDPIEAMIKAIDPSIQFKVEETLWDGGKCKIEVWR